MSKVILSELSTLGGAGTLKVSGGSKIDLSKSNSYLQLPKGTTEERPIDAIQGDLRYNTETKLVEYHDGTQWQELEAPKDYNAIVKAGLVLHLDASNEESYPGSGNRWSDLTSYGNDGTLVGGTEFNANENTMDFDGINDQISCGLSGGALTTEYTYIIWFKFDQGTRTAGSGRKDILYGINYSRPHFTFDREGDGKWGNYLTKNGSGNDTVKSTTSTWNNNQWYMIATTGNPSRDRIYVDGVLENEVALSGSYTSWSTFNFSLASAQAFPGQIAAVQFYDRELTPGEIWKNYVALAPRFGINPIPSISTNGLVLNLDAANYKSYPKSGTTWTDLSGNQNNGSLIGGVNYNSNNGGYFDFNGIDGYVSVDNILRTSNTIEGWIYSKDGSQGGTGGDTIISAIGNYSPTGNIKYTYIGVLGSNILTYRIDDGVTSHRLVADVTYNENQWYHVALTYNSNGTTVAYLNGKQIGNINATANINFDNNPLNISRAQNGNYFNGLVSSFRLYNRALTSIEVLQNFNALRTRYGL